jgi:hypothetical protein
MKAVWERSSAAAGSLALVWCHWANYHRRRGADTLLGFASMQLQIPVPSGCWRFCFLLHSFASFCIGKWHYKWQLSSLDYRINLQPSILVPSVSISWSLELVWVAFGDEPVVVRISLFSASSLQIFWNFSLRSDGVFFLKVYIHRYFLWNSMLFPGFLVYNSINDWGNIKGTSGIQEIEMCNVEYLRSTTQIWNSRTASPYLNVFVCSCLIRTMFFWISLLIHP